MSSKTYFVKFQDETIEEAIMAHGGSDSGYKSVDDALDDAIHEDQPFIIVDNNMEVVYKEPDYVEESAN